MYFEGNEKVEVDWERRSAAGSEVSRFNKTNWFQPTRCENLV